MAECSTTLTWQRGDAVRLEPCYVQAHVWSLECSCEVSTESTVQLVYGPKPRARVRTTAESFVAHLSWRHMAQFLEIATKRGFWVESYTDFASGLLNIGSRGIMAVTRVSLKPYAVFYGEFLPTQEDIEAMHREAHQQCFLPHESGLLAI